MQADTTITPLPLTYGQATEQCLRLRQAGWTWSAISRIMRDYHGHTQSIACWRSRALTLAPYYGVRSDSLKRPMTPNKRAALERRHAANRRESKMRLKLAS